MKACPHGLHCCLHLCSLTHRAVDANHISPPSAAFQRGRGQINREQIVTGGCPRSAQTSATLDQMSVCVSICSCMFIGLSKWSYVYYKHGVSVCTVHIYEGLVWLKMAERADSRSSHPPHEHSPLLWHCCPHSPMIPRWPIWMQAGDNL